jgi:hypothetical protein
MRLLRTLAVVLVAALTTIGVALAATSSPRARRAATAQNTIAGGVLAQTNSRDGSAILTAAAMRPGDRAQGTVTITNSGDLPGAFTLATAALADVPGPNGGRLSARLQLDVSDITDRSAPVAVGSSPLGAMPARDLGTFAAGGARTYLFVVTFPDGGIPASGTTGDNAYLGSTARVRFDWTSRSAETTPAGPPVVAPGPVPALTFAVTPRTRISLRRTTLTARCSRACTVTVSGSVVSVRGRSKRVLARVKARRYAVRAGAPRKVAIRLKPKVRRAIKRALKQHRVVTLRLKVVATGPATAPGRVTRNLRIRVRP